MSGSLRWGTVKKPIAAVASVLLMSAVLPWTGLVAAQAASATLPTSGPYAFEAGDGDMTVESPSTLDWANVPATNLPDLAAECPAGTDDIFSQGTKENDVNVTVACSSSPPKVDLIRAYEWTQTVGTDTYLYMAWEAPNQSGSNNNHIDFELNQLAQPAPPQGGGAWQLNRKVGDLLFDFDVTPGVPTVSVATWGGSAWSAETALSSTDEVGAVNGTGFTDPVSGGYLPTGGFGEVGIDLTAAGIFSPTTCSHFASFWVKSRSSGSGGTSEMKDFIAPVPVTVSNCADLKIEKFGPDGTTPVPGATFSITPDPTTGAGSLTVVDSNANGVLDYPAAIPGTYYTVTETLPPPGYLLPASPSATQTLSADSSPPFVFRDPLGQVSWSKVDGGLDGKGTTPVCGATFTLTATGGDAATLMTSPLTVADNCGTAGYTGADANPAGGAFTVGNLYTGTYSLSETTAPTGFTVDPKAQTFTIDTANASVDLSATPFVDTRVPSTLTVLKVNGSGTPLSGAVFTLYREAGSSPAPSTDTSAGTCSTATTGECSVSGLDWGYTYYWVETTPPSGYNVPSPDVFPVSGIQVLAADAGTTFAVTEVVDTASGVTTSATPEVTLPTATATDSATLSGLNDTAAGTLTFKLYGPFTASETPDCTGTPVYTSSGLPVTGNGTYGPATSGALTSAGYYYWQASYSGDTNGNKAVTGVCGDSTETTLVNPAAPTLGTTPGAPVTLPGVSVSDTATLSGFQAPLTNGAAADTMTFSLYGPSATAVCTGSPIHTDTVTVDSTGKASDSVPVTVAGDYWWVVTFGGDPNNVATTSPCGAEESVVNAAQPGIVTDATAAATLPDAPIADSATLSNFQAPLTSTGATGGTADTVTFTLYGPSPTAVCTAADQVGSPQVVTLSSTGTASAPGFTVQQAGTYWWTASYGGDPNNAAVASSCGDEQSVVSAAAPSITTTPTASITLPGSISDAAQVTGYQAPLTTGSTPDTMTFTLFGPASSATCTEADQVATQTVAVGSDGSASTTPVSVVSAGDYWWVATFNGDANNASATSACGAEESVVNAASVIPPPTPAVSPALSISKASVPPTGSFVHRGDTVVYTLTYANTGGAAADNVVLTDALPADETLVSDPGATFDSTSSTLSWAVGTVDANRTGTVTFTVKVAQTATNGEDLHNVGVLTSGTTVIDSNPDDLTVVVPSGALTLTKTVSPTTGVYGGTLTYTLLATAGGTLTQTDVRVTDVIPAGTAYVAGSASCPSPCVATFDAATNLVTWQVGTLVAGASMPLKFMVTITKPVAGTGGAIPSEVITNYGLVSSSTQSPTPSNIVKTVVTAVLGLKIVKKTPAAPAAPAAPATATLPFTGLSIPLWPTVDGAAALIALGGLLWLAGSRNRRGMRGLR